MLIRRAVRLTVISFFLFQGVSLFAERPATKVGTYDQLVRAIREVRAARQASVEQAKVREAWETGRLIHEHVLSHEKRAGYGQEVVLRLAKDLGTSRTELSYMLQFSQAFPIFPTSEILTWSDYRELLSLNDAAQRAEVGERAAREKWDTQRIRSEVKKIKAVARTGEEPVKRLAAEPGIPFTYRVVPGANEGERVIDLGFSNYYTPAGKFSFQDKDILRFVNGKFEEQGGANPESLLYTYETQVLEVIDGDTIKAVIDLGFGFRTVQKLRLRGIDAPEIGTEDGAEAKEALESMLKTTKGPVLIKTAKSDKYDRYLADVFYPPPKKAGRSNPPSSVADADYVYINRRLVEEGLAVVVEG